MIATFEKPVVDVPDLDAGARFWSALTGFETRPPFDPHGKFVGLGRHDVDGEESVQMLLQRVEHPIVPGSTHLDFKVKDVAKAIVEVQAIGGRLKKKADFYPDKESAYLEWAVMEDPWGTPFCLIRFT